MERDDEEFIDLDEYENINLVAIIFVAVVLLVGVIGVMLLTEL